MGRHSNVGTRNEETQQDRQDGIVDEQGRPSPEPKPEGNQQQKPEEPKEGFLVRMLRGVIHGFKWVDTHTPKPVKAVAGGAVVVGALYLAGKEGYKLGVKSVKPLEPTNDTDDNEEADLGLLEESETPEGWSKYENDGVEYFTDDPDVIKQLDADPAFSKVEEA